LGLTFLLWGFLLSPIQAEEMTEVPPETTEIPITEQSITTGEAVAEVESNNEIDNNASLEVGNSAVAITGENQSSNDDDTDITVDTGEATAEIINQNQVNTNVLDVATTTVENNNEAEVTAENEAMAATGENEVVTESKNVASGVEYDFTGMVFLDVEKFTKFPKKEMPTDKWKKIEWEKSKKNSDQEIRIAWNKYKNQ